jgi:hypothetical protein
MAGRPASAIAPALTAENPSPAPWTQEQLQSYLRNGFSVLHGVAAGPMSPVPHGLSALPESDGRAIATYFADVDHTTVALGLLHPVVDLHSNLRLGRFR